MKRIIIVFSVLVIGFSVGLWLKVRENRAIQLRPAGGSGVIEGVDVDISSRITSRITAIYVQEGESVKRGQVLVTLDCQENQALLLMAQAKQKAAQSNAGAARSQANAALGTAHAARATIRATGSQSLALQANREASSRQVQRIEQLQGEGGATASDLDQVTTQVRSLSEQIQALQAKKLAARNHATAASAQAEAARKQAEGALAAVTGAQGELARAQTLVDECLLRSPISGVVTTRAFEPGEVVLPGYRVLTVVELDEVKTTFYVPNQELAAAVPGKTVTVMADAYPGQLFVGRISSVAAEAEFTPRNVQTREDRDRLVFAVHVQLKNPDAKLRPGMPVNAFINGNN